MLHAVPRMQSQSLPIRGPCFMAHRSPTSHWTREEERVTIHFLIQLSKVCCKCLLQFHLNRMACSNGNFRSLAHPWDDTCFLLNGQSYTVLLSTLQKSLERISLETIRHQLGSMFNAISILTTKLFTKGTYVNELNKTENIFEAGH